MVLFCFFNLTVVLKLLLLSLISTVAGNVIGQNYYLSFKAQGGSENIDSVQVTNVNLKITKTVLGNEILYLNDSTLHTIKQKPADKNFSAINPSSSIRKLNFRKGDLIKLVGFSGQNKTVVMTIPENDKIISFWFNQCMDVDGNSYAIMKIGNQLWMVENLRTTHYRNGDTIPNITNKYKWDTLKYGAYRNYYDDKKQVLKYGRLYNWYAVNDTGGLAPAGWRIPDVDDWTKMENTNVPGDKGNAMGSKLKEWALIPAGYCEPTSEFGSLGKKGYWWLSYDESLQKAWYCALNFHQSSVSLTNCDKHHGFSVRCVKDLPQNR